MGRFLSLRKSSPWALLAAASLVVCTPTARPNPFAHHHPAAHPAMVHPAMMHPAMMHPAMVHPAMMHPGLAHPGMFHPAMLHAALAHPHLAALHAAAVQHHQHMVALQLAALHAHLQAQLLAHHQAQLLALHHARQAQAALHAAGMHPRPPAPAHAVAHAAQPAPHHAAGGHPGLDRRLDRAGARRDRLADAAARDRREDRRKDADRDRPRHEKRDRDEKPAPAQQGAPPAPPAPPAGATDPDSISVQVAITVMLGEPCAACDGGVLCASPFYWAAMLWEEALLLEAFGLPWAAGFGPLAVREFVPWQPPRLMVEYYRQLLSGDLAGAFGEPVVKARTSKGRAAEVANKVAPRKARKAEGRGPDPADQEEATALLLGEEDGPPTGTDIVAFQPPE